jgi:ATP-dependent RNA helicase DeaD
MSAFSDTGLNEELVKAVTDLGFEKPTPIQAKTIPHLLASDRDLIALAQTGTGKTAAFGLPALHMTDPDDGSTQTLVLCPTRELCLQIVNDLSTYSKYMKKVNVVAVYGGSSIQEQIRELKRGAQIVVGTPGRTRDLIKRKRLDLSNVKRLILDEADEMLTMGFKEELDAILEETPAEKQTLLFSATMSRDIINVTKKYMNDPLQLSVASMNEGAKNVEHIYYMAQSRDRYEVLKRIADINPDIYGIVFCRTRRETREIANKLMHDGYNADALYGDLSQAQRDEVMERFRSGQIQILVATDVAARGLDVNDLTHVININLPDNAESYIHRSGRTGRAGKSGISIAIIHTRETRSIREIERRSGIKFTKELIPTGKDICEKQLFTLIDKIQNINVDDEVIDPFMPAIYEKLESLSREELIKHFVSAEFNRFLDYYKNARDINVPDRPVRERRDSRDSSSRDRRDSGRDRDSGREKRTWEDRRKTPFTRLYINVGASNDLNPKRLIGIINHALDSGNAEIGKIEVTNKCAFFEIDEKVAPTLMTALRGQVFEGVSLLVEVSPEKSRKRSSYSGKSEGGSRRNYRGDDKRGDSGKRGGGGRRPRR